MKIYHYTSIRNLALILHSKKMRFSRLDKVDDIEEAAYGSGQYRIKLGQYCFVSCWTKSNKENLALWNMYTNYRGVRIGIESIPFVTYKVNDNFYSLIDEFEHYDDDYIISSISCPAKLYDIIYVKDPEAEISKIVEQISNNGLLIKKNEIGIYKREEWKIQEESRFILIVTPFDKDLAYRSISADDYDITRIMKLEETVYPSLIRNKPIKKTFFDLPLDPIKLNNIEVMLGPMTDDADEIIVRSLLKDFPNAHIQFSKFRDKLRNHT